MYFFSVVRTRSQEDAYDGPVSQRNRGIASEVWGYRSAGMSVAAPNLRYNVTCRLRGAIYGYRGGAKRARTCSATRSFPKSPRNIFFRIRSHLFSYGRTWSPSNKARLKGSDDRDHSPSSRIRSGSGRKVRGGIRCDASRCHRRPYISGTLTISGQIRSRDGRRGRNSRGVSPCMIYHVKGNCVANTGNVRSQSMGSGTGNYRSRSYTSRRRGNISRRRFYFFPISSSPFRKTGQYSSVSGGVNGYNSRNSGEGARSRSYRYDNSSLEGPSSVSPICGIMGRIRSLYGSRQRDRLRGIAVSVSY